MLDKKYFLTIILFLKYLFLLNITPELETERYLSFFNQCVDLRSCINPYKNIELLEQKFLTFPYSNLMYFVLLPFYFISGIFGVSFVNLSYLVFELLLIIYLKKLFNISLSNLYLILIFNPLIVFSIGILGQLDLIPLTYFVISIFYLKAKKKYYSILFLILAFSSKIIFIILLPIIILYFLKIDENIYENLITIIYTFLIVLFLNLQLFFDPVYLKTVFFGISRGYDVVNASSNIFNNNVLVIMIFLSFTLFMYWKNIHRLDFVGVCIFTGFMTFPIYITNLSNIGWLLWSYPSLLILFYSYEYKIKTLVMTLFSLLVISNRENAYFDLRDEYLEIFNFLIYFSSILIIYYLFQILSKNIYFKIKSSPIVISLAGDSAVGKTTLSNSLQNYFGRKFVDKIELDSFHKFERNNPIWKEKTHLDPEMNDLIKFKATVLNLLSGQTELVRNYNHLNGKFDSVNKKRIKNFLLIEGLHSQYFHDLNKKYDLSIFLDLETKIKEESKLIRDKERGKTQEAIMYEIDKRKKDFHEFVFPQSKNSDIYIKTINRNSSSTTFSIFLINDYFIELKKLISEILNTPIANITHESGLVKFDFCVLNNESVELFEALTKNIKNLENSNFYNSEIFLNQNSELLCKLSIALFVLDKKIETKI